jgi:hypothetical protein
MLLLSIVIVCLALIITQIQLTHFRSRTRIFLWILLALATPVIHGLAATGALVLVTISLDFNPLQNSQHGLISLGITIILFLLTMSLLQWVLWRDRDDALFRAGTTAIAQTAAWYFFPAVVGEGIDRVMPAFLWLSPLIAIAVGCAVGFMIDKAAPN